MLNRSASLAMSTSALKALPGKFDIKRHSPSILYTYVLVKDGQFVAVLSSEIPGLTVVMKVV